MKHRSIKLAFNRFPSLLILLGLTFLFYHPSHGQNLVPNPSFEDTIGCPYDQDQVNFSTGWSKFSEFNSTPDYFNACANPGFFGVPHCGFGYQPSRSGVAHSGVITFFEPALNYREHIGTQLATPMVIGQTYYVSFYTVMAEVFGFGKPANNIGMLFSTVAYNSNSPVPIDNYAHLHSTTIISDTANWNFISGSIVADSAYNYLIIGNFFDDVNTDTLTYDSLSNQSYYYVDDICVSVDPACNFPTSLIEEEVNEIFDVFPNPALDYLNIITNDSRASFDVVHINVANLAGQVVIDEYMRKKIMELDLSSLLAGFYILKIFSIDSSILYTHKFVKH